MNSCIKCGEPSEYRRITVDDGEFTSVLGEQFCDDCYKSLSECIFEMVYGEEA